MGPSLLSPLGGVMKLVFDILELAFVLLVALV